MNRVARTLTILVVSLAMVVQLVDRAAAALAPDGQRMPSAGPVEKRLAEGRTRRETRRCLKRYIARHLYRALNALHDTATT